MLDLKYVLICLIILMVTTYLPRALPITLFRKKITSRFFRSFLKYVPYAIIMALTFPGILYTSSNIYVSLIGTLVAIVLSLFNQKLYVVALVSVAVVYGLSYLF